MDQCERNGEHAELHVEGTGKNKRMGTNTKDLQGTAKTQEFRENHTIMQASVAASHLRWTSVSNNGNTVNWNRGLPLYQRIHLEPEFNQLQFVPL